MQRYQVKGNSFGVVVLSIWSHYTNLIFSDEAQAPGGKFDRRDSASFRGIRSISKRA